MDWLRTVYCIFYINHAGAVYVGSFVYAITVIHSLEMENLTCVIGIKGETCIPAVLQGLCICVFFNNKNGRTYSPHKS